MKHYCLGFIFDEDNQNVVLIKKARPDWMKGSYNGIGGEHAYGEIPVEAMRRKVRAEVGVIIHQWTHVFSLHGKGKDGKPYQVWVFRTNIENFKQIQTMTDEEVKSFPVDEINVPVVNDIRWMIPLMLEHHEWPVDFRRVMVPVNAKEKEKEEEQKAENPAKKNS